MDSSSASASSDTDPPAIGRRNSIATSVVVPTTLSFSLSAAKPLHSASFPIQYGSAAAAPSLPPPPSLDFELFPFKTSSLYYTSLKDLLPSSPSAAAAAAAAAAGLNSPTAACSEISIRNRLVKQAAWAYLQPMSASPSSSGPHFLRRLWLRLSSQNVVASCLSFINRHVILPLSRAVDHLINALRRFRTPVR